VLTATKILHLHFGKEGGAERFFVNLARAIRERGMEQRFVIRPHRSWRDEVAACGAIIENHYRRLSLSGLLLTWRVRRLIRAWRPDVIMAWMPRAARLIPNDPAAIKLTRLGDLPRHLRHFRYNDVIVSTAPGVVERCRALGWSRPIRLISNFPRDVAPVPVDRARLDTPRDAFVVCGSGRFTAGKAFDTLVRAVSKVPGAWLWLVGEGEERPRLESLAAEVGIADRTRFTGWVDEPIHYVAASDVLCLPSRHEVLGNVILEGWHAGVPTVSTRSQGPSWLIADGEDGLLCGIDDVDGLAAAIDRIRTDPGLAQHLVENGRAKLAARFTKERILDQYVELFESRAVR
jgi:glycosyltransferase involved in cell wall biosynthesis